jgi:hypothetical protein
MLGMKIGAAIVIIVLALAGVIRFNPSAGNKRAVWGHPIVRAILVIALITGVIRWLLK